MSMNQVPMIGGEDDVDMKYDVNDQVNDQVTSTTIIQGPDNVQVPIGDLLSDGDKNTNEDLKTSSILTSSINFQRNPSGQTSISNEISNEVQRGTGSNTVSPTTGRPSSKTMASKIMNQMGATGRRKEGSSNYTTPQGSPSHSPKGSPTRES